MECEGLAKMRLCAPGELCPPAEHYQLRYMQPGLYAHPCGEVLRLAREASTALFKRRAAGAARRARLPTLIHVGCKDLSNDRTKPFYAALFGNRSDLSDPCLEAVMVEANPDVAALLEERLREYFSDFSCRRRVLSAAVCAADAEASFFSLSEQVHTKYSVQELGGVKRWDSWGTLNLNFLLQNLADILARRISDGSDGRRIQVEDLMPFIQERTVTCISPGSLLQKEGLEPSFVDMLFLDTQDALRMLSAFLALGLRPAILRFHWAWDQRQIADQGYATEVSEAVAFLASESYHLYQFGEFFVALRASET